MRTRSQVRKELESSSNSYNNYQCSLLAKMQRTTKQNTFTMKTRSATRKQSIYVPQELEVNIDFDDASKCWMKNKKKLANGCYIYKKT
jgi:hypothetical protein